MLLILVAMLAGSAQAQFEYALEPFSAKDMNLKGAVKKVTELQVSTDRKGEVDDSEKKYKVVYEFDASGNLLRIQQFEVRRSDDLVRTSTYEYAGGRLSRVNRKAAFSSPYTEIFTYSGAQVLVKHESGDLSEVRTLSNGRVTEIKSYGSDQKQYRNRYVFDYNSDGQVQKRDYKDDAESYRKYYSSESYAYNRKGDRSKSEKFGNEGKLEWITDYDYKYDKNNWVSCKTMFYQPGEDKDDRVYTLYTRTYEYY